MKGNKSVHLLLTTIYRFKDELEDWNTCTNKVMKLHADYNDTLPLQSEQTMEYEDMDIGSISEHLDDVQKEFLEKYCNKARDEKPREAILERLGFSTTIIKQRLDTARLLTNASASYTESRFQELARQLHECNRLVPIDADTDPYNETTMEEKLKNEQRNAERVLRLMALKTKK